MKKNKKFKSRGRDENKNSPFEDRKKFCPFSQKNSPYIDYKDIKVLGELPSREELIVKLLYLLNAPISRLVSTFNEVPASFVRLIQAYAESKK